jgi:hypothetical protein
VTGTPPLQPDCARLVPLLGTWQGRGDGDYPTIEAFSYTEELVFSHVGKPFVAMTQRTRDAEDGLPLHSEAGYFRPQPGGTVELVLAQPSGVLEIDSGPIVSTQDGLELDLTSLEVPLSPSAKKVTDVRRRLVVSGDELVSEVWMAAVGLSLEPHLRAVLHRVT